MKRLAAILIMLALCYVASGQVRINESPESFIKHNRLNPAPTSMTVCAWAKQISATGTDSGYVISQPYGASPYHNFALRCATNSARVQFDTSAGLIAVGVTTNLTSTGLRFIAGTFDSGTVRLYLDGVLIASSNRPGATLVFNAFAISWAYTNIFIGAWNGYVDTAANVLDIDDARVYTRALSDNEIAEIANVETAWMHKADPALVLRTCIVTNDTGTALTGVAYNYGTGADGTYSNSPTVAQPHVQHEKPLTMELP